MTSPPPTSRESFRAGLRVGDPFAIAGGLLLVATDEVLLALYPRDELADAEERPALFLIQSTPAADNGSARVHSQRRVRGAWRIRSTRTGTPAATALSGTSLETIVDVPSTQLSPTVTPRRIATP